MNLGPRRRQAVVLAVLAAVAGASIFLSLVEARLNHDELHWGIIYSGAFDLLRGRMPYRETYEIYGLLSSALNAAALALFGPSLVTLGVAVGVVHALAFVVSYALWRTVLPRAAALAAVVVNFCLMPYVYYPWPNYYAYLLTLLSALVLLRRRGRAAAAVAAGALAAAAVLARTSFVLTVVPAFAAFFALAFARERPRRAVRREAALFGAGFVAPMAVFGAGLAARGLLRDFWTLTVTVSQTLLKAIESWQGKASNAAMLLDLLRNMFVPATLPHAVFVAINCAALITIARAWRRRDGGGSAGPALLLALLALCGNAQAMHTYEIFRVEAASFVGFALLPLLASELPMLRTRAGRIVGRWALILLAAALGRHILDQAKPPTGERWPADALSRSVIQARPSNVALLDGKAWPSSVTSPLLHLHAALRQAVERCATKNVVNLTASPLDLYLLDDFNKLQREPSRISWHKSDELFPDERQSWAPLLAHGDLLVIDAEEGFAAADYATLAVAPKLFLHVPERCAHLITGIARAEDVAVDCPRNPPKAPPVALADVYAHTPFKAGEVATYAVSWSGIAAGEATLEVREPRKFDDSWHRVFHLSASTGEWFKSIFVAKEAVDVLSRPSDFAAGKFYLQQNEGKIRQRTWSVYDHARCRVTERREVEGKPAEVKVHQLSYGATDAMSVVYSLRARTYRIGVKEKALVYTGGKNWRLEAEPLAMEDVTVPAGTFGTVKLRLQTFIGEELQQKGDVFLWVATSTPEKQLVQVQGDIDLGSVWMKLSRYRPR